jgi:hypothetical protein
MFHFHPLEMPFRREVGGPIPRSIAPLLKLFLKVRKFLLPDTNTKTLFIARMGGALTVTKLGLLVGDITETYVDTRVPLSAFRDIFAYNWLVNHKDEGENVYITLASILWESIHGVKMRYNKEYRAAFLEKIRSRPAKRRHRHLAGAAKKMLASLEQVPSR